MRAGTPFSQSLRIAALYALGSAGWILLSDRLAGTFIQDPDTLLLVNTLKGWFFVAVTALLLLLLVRRQLILTTAAANARANAEAARARAETQQKLACEAASSAASRLSVAAHGAHIGTWEWDMAGGRVLFDAQMHEIYGLAPGAFAGTTDAWLLRLHPDDREQVRRLNRTIAEGQREFHTQFRILRTDGQVRHVEIHAQVVRDGSGWPLRVSGINLDITERVVAEQRYRFLTDNISDVLWVVDTDTGCYTYVSPSVFRLRGCTPESLVGKSIEYGLSPTSVALIRERMQPLLKAFLAGDPSAVALTHDIEQLRADGTKVWTEVATTFIRNDRGGVEIIGVSRDISERYAAEQALRASALRLAHAEEVAGIGHWTFHIETAQVDGSGNAARLCGLPPGRLWALAQINDLILPEYREQTTEALRAAAEDGQPYDLVYKLRRADDGAIATVHARGERDAEQRVVFGTIQDITAQRASEEQLRLRSAALESSALSVTITDAVGCVEWINPAFVALTGYQTEETLGKRLNQLIRSDRHSTEFYLQIQSTILAGNTWHGEMFERRKDGTQIPVEQTITPVRDDEGRVAHIIVIGQDIAERRRLQEQALRAQRLDSVGRLAGGIAHDLNNILVPILMAPAVLRDELTDPAALEILDSVETSANRGAAIIRQLLTFSRGGGAGGERLPVQLRHIVGDMVSIIRETFPKNIVTRTDLPSEPWLVAGDATQLHQVLMNLCVNSRDGMPTGGTLTITLENVELDAAAVASHPGTAPGPHLLLGVFDTGTGIPADHLDKVFDPFFTTKAVGQGTGLGLATALGIVQSHRGLIQIGSRPGAGTQVRVYLPAVPAASAPAPEAAAAPLPLGHGELILLVDDEDNIRRITRSSLEQQGYRVLAASDGAEALACFQQHHATIRVVLTDLLMPFMDGHGLIQAVRQIDPTMCIIAVSGHAAEPDPNLPATVSAFLAKPYSRHQLLQTVAAVLDPARN